jgi:hypothetical protein
MYAGGAVGVVSMYICDSYTPAVSTWTLTTPGLPGTSAGELVQLCWHGARFVRACQFYWPESESRVNKVVLGTEGLLLWRQSETIGQLR